MKLENGTTAEVSQLALDGDTITAVVDVTWPGGVTAQGSVSFSPSMEIRAWTMYAPGTTETRKPLPPVSNPVDTTG